MNRLGLEAAELAAARRAPPRLAPGPGAQPPRLRRRARPSDEPRRRPPPSRRSPRRGCPASRLSLAATGGILLGPGFHHGLTRPGIGLYGGLPFAAARPVVTLALPVIQVRDVAPGEARRLRRRLDRAARPARDRHRRRRLRRRPAARARRRRRAALRRRTVPCPVVGRVSMDLDHRRRHRAREVPRPPRNPERAPDGRRARRGRGDHRLRDPHQPWRPLRTRLQGGRPPPDPA